VSRSQLRGWLAQLEDGASQADAGRAILAVSAPEVTEDAVDYCQSRSQSGIPVEIYLESEPGQFTRVA
jgi:hypothetical protein